MTWDSVLVSTTTINNYVDGFYNYMVVSKTIMLAVSITNTGWLL